MTISWSSITLPCRLCSSLPDDPTTAQLRNPQNDPTRPDPTRPDAAPSPRGRRDARARSEHHGRARGFGAGAPQPSFDAVRRPPAHRRRSCAGSSLRARMRTDGRSERGRGGAPASGRRNGRRARALRLLRRRAAAAIREGRPNVEGSGVEVTRAGAPRVRYESRVVPNAASKLLVLRRARRAYRVPPCSPA
jgi:hypothetical protein